MNRFFKIGVVAAAACMATSAFAAQRTASGQSGNLFWEAQSLLTGATSIGTGGTGTTVDLIGSSIYHPSFPGSTGVVGILMDFGPSIGAFVCSGTLMNDRQSILTAAHCVTDFAVAGGPATLPVTTTIYFQPAGGLTPGQRIYDLPAGVVTRTISNYTIHPLYTGDVIDQNDIAVIRMSSAAPAYATSFGINTVDPEGQVFNVSGYGRIGTGTAGSVTITGGSTGRLRSGSNRYDFRLGNPIFGQNWATVLGEPFSQIQNSYISDFDNGLAINDASCLVAQASNVGGAAGAAFCNTGLGNPEVGVAGGDSGGPNFIGNLVSGVNSYGLTFGTSFGDSLTGLNNSFGEFSGYVPTHIHTAFIAAALVPEPGTYGMMALGMLGIAAVARRRKAD